MDASGTITDLLRSAAAGDPRSAERLYETLYQRLRDLARGQMGRSLSSETLQPTALVHEAWLKLSGGTRCDWRDREHFLAAAARAMRCVLVDSARRRDAAKRGRDACRMDLQAVVQLFDEPATDLLALDEALQRLATRNADQARVVELHFFGGMTMEEAARTLGVSRATAERLWYLARAWLRMEICG